ncbi:ABC transporter ATP-binding protein [Frigidibacter sp. ROC022]|uniref:ABC transporter ATP-binding protein n=1 Tax=Frigidibacter sp. ROC022 TaxID=2971796 RepID=UPI00215B5F90|nr:ABC transporter ATP-binding protein [Frigidibacter sp. ROC022]MCR8726485.1 ABC transporter ATP-binding protein [Frigidibacter sp. ROC022]
MSGDLLVIDRVIKRFGGLKAVGGDAGLSFSVPRGAFLGLIGPNGAGKSTTFNLISGVLKPDSGSVTLDGHNLSLAGAAKIASYGLGRTFQTPRAFPSLTVLENVTVGCDNRGETIASVALGRWRSAERELREKAREVLDRVGLSDRVDDSVGNLSGGELRMLEVARQLVRDPRILLLDEPTAGVDPTLQTKLSKILVDLHAEGCTLVVVEHNLHFLMQIADSIVVLQNGELLSQGSPQAIKSDEKVIAAYLGSEHAT